MQQAWARTGTMTNEELAMRLPTLASELGPQTALRLAAVRLLRRHGNTIAIVFEVVPIRWTGIGLG